MREISFDFGGTFTDIVIFQDGEIEKKTSFPRESFTPKEIENFIRKDEFEKIFTVGGNQDEVPDEINGKKIFKVNEINAIGAGGLFLSKLEEALVVSVGTGVCFVFAQSGYHSHIGGTAVGGGTLSGLGKIILGENSLEKLSLLAKKGNAKKINLTIKDIVGGGIGILPSWVPASYFAKANKEEKQSKEDLAAAIFSLCSGVISSSLIFATKYLSLNKVVLGGRLTNNPIIFDEIKKIGKVFDIEIIKIPNPEIMTALGAKVFHS